MLAHQDALLDLGLLDIPLLIHRIDAITVLHGDHLVVLHLLHLLGDSFIVSLFKFHNFTSALTGLLDFLPRLHLFLLEESNSIG